MNYLQIFAAFASSLGLAIVFSVSRHPKFIFMGAIIGAIGWTCYLMFSGMNIYFRYFLASLVVAFLSEIMARLNKAPATIFTLVGIFPLVPGGLIYQTMLYAFEGEVATFLSSFVNTMSISISIALAILVSNTFFKVRKMFICKRRIS